MRLPSLLCNFIRGTAPLPDERPLSAIAQYRTYRITESFRFVAIVRRERVAALGKRSVTNAFYRALALPLLRSLLVMRSLSFSIGGVSVKASFSALSGLAVTAMLAATALSGCSGGGSTTVPNTPAAVNLPAGGGNASVQIGSLDLMHPASTVPVQVTSRTPAAPNSDARDQATVTMTAPASDSMTVTDSASHAFAGGLHRTTSSASRATKDVATNAPYDLSYHGNYVLGSAVSHNLFVNCDNTCRQNENFNPGQFLTDLGNDQFITLLYQYITPPGVVPTVPLTGSFTKGLGALENVTYAGSNPTGGPNSYYGERAIWSLVANAAGPPGSAPNNLGNGGLGNIYHVFLPKNVDTCMEQFNGSTYVSTGQCYSPDAPNDFYFCGYHGAVTFTSGSNHTTYLYTVEPYEDVAGCRNAVYNQGTLPNAASPTVDPADPGYSTLSHELFETISDPLLRSWYNNFSGGQEIGDICAEFDNFVTVSGHPYVLQSEYSDLHHVCVSATLNGSPQTPQAGPYQ